KTMCYYQDIYIKYRGCTAEFKHLVTKTKYDKCAKALREGYPCVDAKRAKAYNDKGILLGSCPQEGACPKCLS
ncbi:hypothetical protein C8A03DRAFT_17998, partial [Achaetomium macrosporum]